MIEIHSVKFMTFRSNLWKRTQDKKAEIITLIFLFISDYKKISFLDKGPEGERIKLFMNVLKRDADFT